MPKIAFATCVTLPEPDVDEGLLLEASGEAGLDAVCAAWDDPSVDWSQFDAVIVRSTWNYHLHIEAFRTWVSQTSAVTQLWNSAEVILANSDKRYLLDLERKGVPIVPTFFCDDGDHGRAELADRGWHDFVIKPSVSCGSYMTAKFSMEDWASAEAHVAKVLRECQAMIQPFVASVADGGEVALIHIDGKLTHAVAKHPRFIGEEESVSPAFEPIAAQRAVAEKALGALAKKPLYARVDIMRTSDDGWALSELELIEPSLFFRQHFPALQAFVTALGACGRPRLTR